VLKSSLTPVSVVRVWPGMVTAVSAKMSALVVPSSVIFIFIPIVTWFGVRLERPAADRRGGPAAPGDDNGDRGKPGG
jgi:hypothetical protein